MILAAIPWLNGRRSHPAKPQLTLTVHTLPQTNPLCDPNLEIPRVFHEMTKSNRQGLTVVSIGRRFSVAREHYRPGQTLPLRAGEPY